MESSIRVEGQDNSLTTTMTKCNSSSNSSTAELAFESSLQASFAEKTALEMKELIDYWNARITTTATCSSMPHNSLTVLAEEEEEAEEAGSIMEDHDDKEDTASVESSSGHGDGNDDDTVASSYSGPLEQQRRQRNQAPQMPPRHVLFSRERRISTSSSSLTCDTNLEDDDHAELSFSLESKGGGNKQLCDNTTTTTASTQMMMSTYSCDTSTMSESGSSACCCCCQHQVAFFPPLSSTSATTACTAASNCSGVDRYPVVFWSDDNHSINHTTTPRTSGDTPVNVLLHPPLIVSHPCDASEALSPSSSDVVVEHFHWTACQQQTQVNMACSRAQWMADALVALVNHDNHNSNDDDAPVNTTSCNRNASQQQPLLLMLQLLKKRVHLTLRLACGRIANELYIGFCQALPLEYLRLWIYLRHLLIHSYLPSETAVNNNNVLGTSSDHFAKKTLKRDLIMASLFILVIAIQGRIQASLQQPQHATATPCLVCFQPDDTLLSQKTTLPFRTLYFETLHYSSGLSSSSSGQDDLLLL